MPERAEVVLGGLHRRPGRARPLRKPTRPGQRWLLRHPRL